MRALTHEFAGLFFFAVLAFPAAVVHLVTAAPAWVAGVIVAAAAVVCIVWWLRHEYVMSRDSAADPMGELP